MNIALKFWEAGPLLGKVGQVCSAAFDRIMAACSKLVLLTDAENCPGAILSLLAWQRGITRLSGEDDALFRKRVKHAFANAMDAGSAAGFERIWERLGLGAIIQTERADAVDWDVIQIRLDDARFAPYRGLFEELVTLYGRTCRRYVLVQSDDPGAIGLRPFAYECATDNFTAAY